VVAYRRYYIKGGTWFFTVNLKDRRSMHLTENIELLRYSVAVVKQHRPFIIDAWVVLPEHLHCIWTLPHNDDDFSSRWRDIKGCFTRMLKRHPLWQPRFWEHAIRDEDDYRRHVDYIHINPLKHGWVTRVIGHFQPFIAMSSAGYIPQIGLAIALILAAVNADSLSPVALTLTGATNRRQP